MIAPRDVDLLELRSREAAAGLAGNVHGPELRADAAALQPREIRLTWRRWSRRS